MKQITKSDWTELDEAIRAILKKDVIFVLPRATTNIYMVALLIFFSVFYLLRKNQTYPTLMVLLNFSLRQMRLFKIWPGKTSPQLLRISSEQAIDLPLALLLQSLLIP